MPHRPLTAFRRLLTLDAEVELRSVRGTRVMPLAEFITGYRKTVLAPDEIALGRAGAGSGSPRAASGFVKLGARRYLVISILMAAALIERDEQGRISRAAVAVGAASPVAQRLAAWKAILPDLSQEWPPSSIVSPRHVAGLSPIDDVRATAAYRLEAAITVVGEALDRAAGGRPVADQISFTLNGDAVTCVASPMTRLSDVLRHQIGATGTKIGCDAGDCGACSVLIDGELACACLVPVAQVEGTRSSPSKASRHTR